jgi:hypothetical protein
VSGAGRTLSLSQAAGLAGGGQEITVTGSGYDVNKGVYVTLCVIPPTNLPPSPCGGGQDRSGSSGASSWISSNPPDYAAGLTQPYGPGGSFSVALTVGPAINADLDCYSVRCAVVTRNDHTRGSDRSQDLFVPVTFADSGGGAEPPPADAPPADDPSASTSTVISETTAVAPVETTSTTDAGRTTTTGPERRQEAASSARVESEDDGGSGTGPLMAAGAAAVLLAGGVTAGLRWRHLRQASP